MKVDYSKVVPLLFAVLGIALGVLYPTGRAALCGASMLTGG